MTWTDRLEAIQTWAEAKTTRLLLVSLTAFLGAGLLALPLTVVQGDWFLPVVVRVIVAVPFTLLTLAGLLALGAWMAVLSETTWRQRLHMRILPERRQAPTGARREALERLAQGTHAASEILTKGRRLAWTAGTMALPGGLVILAMAGFFSGDPDATTVVFASLFPLPAVALVGFIRGVQLVLDGRRLVRDIDPKPVAPKAKGKAA